MDFAQKLLNKYGWKEGDGLGKNNDGISKPLRATLKFDTAGLGADKAQDFNNHWWERVFNEAAKNVDINNKGENVVLDVKDANLVEISTKEYSVRKLEKNNGGVIYGNFLKSSTLTNLGKEVENPDKLDVDDIKWPASKQLTDEELFIACGGRTAHKGARHGLKLSGKLARIAEQEKLLLESMQSVQKSKKEKSDEVLVAIVRNKNKTRRNALTVEDDKISELLYSTEYSKKSKKKKLKGKKLENDLSACLNAISIDVGTQKTTDELITLNEKSKIIKKNKKKQRKNVVEPDDWTTYRVPRKDDDGSAEKPEIVENSLVDYDSDSKIEETSSSHQKKCKKKNKSKEVVNNGKVQKKKYKKKMRRNIANITERLSICELDAAEL